MQFNNPTSTFYRVSLSGGYDFPRFVYFKTYEEAMTFAHASETAYNFNGVEVHGPEEDSNGKRTVLYTKGYHYVP